MARIQALSDTTEPASPSDGADGLEEELAVSFRYGADDVIGGKYRLIRCVGSGGMGEVWIARNGVLDVEVALKLLHPDVDDPSAADRLLREARAAARLGHRAIVRVFDFGTAEGGEPFLVMEKLEGEDLASRLERQGRLGATRAVQVILPIAHALAAAHAKGIVHRDVKPENIFLARVDGDDLQPKILDFGIAQLDRSTNLRLTQTGTLVGTPSYMSPEQARGETLDARADIFSLCVVLYETVTGRLPFEGKNSNAVLHAIIMNPPPPITDFEVGDAALWSILSRALAKNVAERYQSMQELGEALAAWLLAKNVTEDISGASVANMWQRSVRPSSAPPPAPEWNREPPVRDAVTLQQVKPRFSRRMLAALAVGLTFLASLAFGLRGFTTSDESSAAATGSSDPLPSIVSPVTSSTITPASPTAPTVPTVPTAPAAAAEGEAIAPSRQTEPSTTRAKKPPRSPAGGPARGATVRAHRPLKDPFH